jgi:L-alanine-DL-glutamate epimerase-like enolase superfamily enzyme
MVDGGMGYTVKRAVQLLRELEPYDIYWLEEPLLADDYDGYRRLSDAASVRIAAGEADSGVGPYRALVELGHVDVLQPDLARCGGFTVGRQIAEMAAAKGAEVVPHCFSTGILVAASLQYTAAMAGATFSELSVASSPFVNGLLTAPFALDDEGRVPVPDGPGLGVTLNDELVERMRLR